MAKRLAPDETTARLTERYLTLRELSAKLGNRSRSAIYVDLAAGRLPAPIKLGGRLLWPEDEIDVWLQNLRERASASAA